MLQHLSGHVVPVTCLLASAASVACVYLHQLHLLHVSTCISCIGCMCLLASAALVACLYLCQLHVSTCVSCMSTFSSCMFLLISYMSVSWIHVSILCHLHIYFCYLHEGDTLTSVWNSSTVEQILSS